MKKYLLTIILFILIIPTVVLAGTCNPSDIEIKNVTLSKTLGTGEEVTAASVDNKSINLDVKLNNPNDYMEYTITVKNNGTEDYYIKEADFNNDQYLKYEFVHENDSFKIEPGEEKEITLRVSYIDRVEGNANYTSTDTLTLNIIDNQTVKVANTLKNMGIAAVILIIITLVSIFIGGGILINNRKKNLLLILIGLAILIPIYANASCDATIDVDVRVELDNKNAMFDVGIEVNKKIKTLAGNTLDNSKPIFNKVNFDAHITSVVRSTIEPESSNKETKNIVSAQDSELPIYMWYDSGTLYWWSEDETPSLNPDSNEFFVGLTKVTNLDTVSKFDVSTANSIEDFFYHCEKLPNIEFLENWNVSNITIFNWLFCSIEVNLDLSPIANWDVSNAVSLQGTFEDLEATDDFSPVSNWNISNVTNIGYIFQCSYSLSNLSFLTNWDVSHVETFEYAFDDCPALEDASPLFNWKTSSAISLEGMFELCGNLLNINFLEKWDISNVETIMCLFYNDFKISSLEPLAKWNTSKVRDLSYSFDNCNAVTSLEPLRNWNVSNVVDVSYMFRNVNLVTTLEPISHWNFTNLQKCSATFSWMTSLTSLDLEGWDVSHVTAMDTMFNHCTGLTNIEGIRNWDVSKVTTMSYLFYYATSLTSIEPIEGWTTTSLKSLLCTFSHTDKLTSANLTHWNTSNVTTMNSLFAGAPLLTSINLLGWNTSKVTDMSWMFNSVGASILDLSTFDTKKVTKFNGMFIGSSNLSTIYIGENWDISANTDDASSVFPATCNLPNFNSSDETKQNLSWAKPTTQGGYLTLKTNN